MQGRLAGKRAFVTGAGQGIGRAIALAFAAEGAQVTAASRTGAKLADLAGRGIAVLELDVTDAAAVAGAIGADLDVLVNAAGWVASGGILETSEADWARSFEQNVTSMFHTIRAALPGMLARQRGSIVNIASVASSITGVPGRAAYGASKAAVIGLTKAVAREVVGRGVRCNALCPGTTLSPSLLERAAATGDAAAGLAMFTARQPMGRLGRPEEMAAAALYLASDEAAFMTGQVMVVDGGQTL